MTKLSEREIAEAAIAAARAEGCVCEVEVKLEETAPGIYVAHIAHDDWCPLIRGREDRN